MAETCSNDLNIDMKIEIFFNLIKETFFIILQKTAITEKF